MRRSALLNATCYMSDARWEGINSPAAVGRSKLPIGQEPGARSPDWAHRCGVQAARLVPQRGRQLTLHTVGLPRPRTAAGWPVPFAGKNPSDPCATERDLEIRCSRERRCQLCGLGIAAGTAYAVRRPGHHYVSLNGETVPWLEGRAPLHLGCLRFSVRYCPELIRQLRQGVANVLREPSGAYYVVSDGVMLDTREYIGFIEPVWHLESIRDSGAAPDAVLRQLEGAATTNARATAILFPRLARKQAQ